MQVDGGSLRKRLVIMDDDPEIAEQICRILAVRYDAVVVADHRTAAEMHPDAALLDISMPGMSGFAVAGRLREANPSMKIIFVTQHSTADYVEAAWEVGAAGYVLKRKMSDDLMPAVDEVLHGGQFAPPGL